VSPKAVLSTPTYPQPPVELMPNQTTQRQHPPQSASSANKCRGVHCQSQPQPTAFCTVHPIMGRPGRSKLLPCTELALQGRPPGSQAVQAGGTSLDSIHLSAGTEAPSAGATPATRAAAVGMLAQTRKQARWYAARWGELEDNHQQYIQASPKQQIHAYSKNTYCSKAHASRFTSQAGGAAAAGITQQHPCSSMLHEQLCQQQHLHSVWCTHTVAAHTGDTQAKHSWRGCRMCCWGRKARAPCNIPAACLLRVPGPTPLQLARAQPVDRQGCM
jgi:hypothetical protein